MFWRVGLIASVLVSVLLIPVSYAQIGDNSPEYDERVRKILKAEDVQYTVDSDGDFKVIYDMGDDRTQMAFIRSTTETYQNMEIREIWSFGYESENDVFPAAIATKLLEDTFIKKLGAWAKAGNRALFVVKLSANADAETLLNALQMALESADEMEEQLTGDTDEF
jgi:hypothetical protein